MIVLLPYVRLNPKANCVVEKQNYSIFSYMSEQKIKLGIFQQKKVFYSELLTRE